MKRGQLLHLIRSIFGAQDHEILCSEFFELLPAYVDLVLASSRGEKPAPTRLPEPAVAQVSHHMAQCPECAEAFGVLLSVARSTE